MDATCLARLDLDADSFGNLVAAAADDHAVLVALQARSVPGPGRAWFDVAALEQSLTAISQGS